MGETQPSSDPSELLPTHCAVIVLKGRAGKWKPYPESHPHASYMTPWNWGLMNTARALILGLGGSAHALELLLLHNDRLVATQKHGPWRRHILGGTQAAYKRKNSFQRR